MVELRQVTQTEEQLKFSRSLRDLSADALDNGLPLLEVLAMLAQTSGGLMATHISETIPIDAVLTMFMKNFEIGNAGMMEALEKEMNKDGTIH